MRVAERWDGRDGLPVEVPSRLMATNVPAPELTPAQRWAIRRRAALALRRAKFSRVEMAVALKIGTNGVKQLLRRTRRLRDEVLADADTDDN